MVSIYRLVDRLGQDVIYPIRDYLHREAKLFHHSFVLGDKHICQRIIERCYNTETALKNIKFLLSGAVQKHLCTIIYESLQNEDSFTDFAAVYKLDDTTGILLGFSCKFYTTKLNPYKLKWRLNTYIPDFKIRERDRTCFYINDKEK